MIFFFKKNYHFICLYQKSLYLCNRNNKNNRKSMKATNIIINLAVLHIIRVVVLEPRGEEGSCM